MESPEGLPNGRARICRHAVSPGEVDWAWAATQGHRETETGTDIQGGGGEGYVVGRRRTLADGP
jgi:hypothetical protein